MRQKLLKTLCLAAGLVVGTATTWAEEKTLTLTSTQSAYVDQANSTTVYDGSTVDELLSLSTQYRDWGTLDGTVKVSSGGKIAFYKFDLAQLKDIKDNISKVNFTFTTTGTSDGKNSYNIRALGYNAEWDASTLTYSTVSNTAGTITGVVTATGSFQPLDTKTAFSTGTSFPKEFEAEATTYVLSGVEAGKDYISFAITTNLIRASKYSPTATLTVTYSEGETAAYTVKYVDADGNELKSSKTKTGVVGDAGVVSDEDKAAIYNADKTKKYVYDSDDASTSSIGKDGNTVVTVTFREAATFSYTVNAVDEDGNVLEQIATGSKFEQEKDTVVFGKYIVKEGVLYKGTRGNCGWWRNEYTLSEDKTVYTIKYTKDAENVAAYVEAEDVEGLTATSASNADVRCSWAKGAYNAGEEAVTLFTLQPGVYTLVANVWGNKADIILNYGEETDWAISLTGSLYEEKKEEVTIATATPVAMKTSGSSSKCLDLVYAIKTADYEAPEAVATTVAELKAQTQGEQVAFTPADATISYVADYGEAFIEDATGAVAISTELKGMLVELGIEAGKKLTGTLYCSYSVDEYSGLPAIGIADSTGVSKIEFVAAAEDFTPTVMTVADAALDANLCRYIEVKNARMAGDLTEGMAVTQGENTMTVSDPWWNILDEFEAPDSILSLKGIVYKDYEGNTVIALTSADAIVEYEDPTSIVTVEGFGGLKDLTDGTKVIVKLTDATVTASSSRSSWNPVMYAQDATGAICFDASMTTALRELGVDSDVKFSGTLNAKLTIDDEGVPQLTTRSTASSELTTSEGLPTAKEVTVAEAISTDNLSAYVSIMAATVSYDKSEYSYYVKVKDQSVALYNLFDITIEDEYADPQIVKGIMGILSGAPVIYPVSIEKDEVATGISNVEAAKAQPAAIYTLDGVKVNSMKLQKGVYIINGKKAVVK